MLNRIGNKNKLAKDLLYYFPEHRNYIETFFGAGAVFFEKQLAKYNFLNDLDGEVHNFWLQVIENKERLLDAFLSIPIHQKTFKYLHANIPTCPTERAARFLFLSNISHMGKMDTLKLRTNSQPKQKVQRIIDWYQEKIQYANFLDNADFREVFSKIAFESGKSRDRDLEQTFIYHDQPYLETNNTYNTPKWTKKDFCDLLDYSLACNVKFAASEFNHPYVLEQANLRGLNTYTVKTRKNALNTKKTEILITNYLPQYSLFD